jgi:acyl carrier protein
VRRTMSAVFDETKKIIARVARCNEDEIKRDTTLKDIKADSLHWVQIIVGMENAFNIEIDFEKMKAFITIEDLVKYVESLKT